MLSCRDADFQHPLQLIPAPCFTLLPFLLLLLPPYKAKACASSSDYFLLHGGVNTELDKRTQSVLAREGGSCPLELGRGEPVGIGEEFVGDNETQTEEINLQTTEYKNHT